MCIMENVHSVDIPLPTVAVGGGGCISLTLELSSVPSHCKFILQKPQTSPGGEDMAVLLCTDAAVP